MKRELILIFAFSSILTLCVAANKYFEAEPSDPQRYTVHFDGIDYQDLTRIGSFSHGTSYKTKAGKRIEFHGSFYEVEQ
jgi:hypothetical protein